MSYPVNQLLSFLILFKPCRYIPHEVISFYPTEIPVLANRIGKVLFIALQEDEVFHVIPPHIFVFAVFFSQCHSIEYMSYTGVI